MSHRDGLGSAPVSSNEWRVVPNLAVVGSDSDSMVLPRKSLGPKLVQE